MQNWDITFNKSIVLSYGKESIVSSTGIGDRHDSSVKVELGVPTQDGVTTSSLPCSRSKVHTDMPYSSTSSPDEP